MREPVHAGACAAFAFGPRIWCARWAHNEVGALQGITDTTDTTDTTDATDTTGSAPDAAAPTEAELISWVKDRLAGYKAPRRVRVVDTIGRAPNGKVDYRRHRTESIEALTPPT